MEARRMSTLKTVANIVTEQTGARPPGAFTYDPTISAERKGFY